MAQNLRAKIPEGDTVVVHDQNAAVTKKFKEEVGIAAAGTGASGKGTGIEIAETSREAAEKSVCWTPCVHCPFSTPYDEHVPTSMI